ncbi:MAG: CBS domain-containing protein [Burkholderiales bacterium]
MKVERVFNQNIVHTTSSATLEQAARLMRDRHVGALLVTEDIAGKKPVGMVTDRDLVIRALAEGAGAQDRTIAEVMSAALATIPRSSNLFEALERMRANGMRRLAVTEPDGSVSGIVSADDLVGALAVQLSSLGGLLRSELLHEVAREGDSGQSAG